MSKKTVLEKVKEQVKDKAQGIEMWDRVVKGYLSDSVTVNEAYEIGVYLESEFEVDVNIK